MFTGSSIDDLIVMVERAERHAVEVQQQQSAMEMGPALVYESQRQEVLEGVA
jgi:hypothetical protein